MSRSSPNSLNDLKQSLPSFLAMTMTEVQLTVLKDPIERMEQCHQVEVLRILSRVPSVQITENSNGCFVNLGKVPAAGLEALEKYKEYVGQQQSYLTEGEAERARLASEFFGGIKETSED